MEDAKDTQAPSYPFNVLTHHKCGSQWLIRYLKSFCSLNALSFFDSHLSRVSTPSEIDVSVQINADYEFISERLLGGIHVIRNPLNVIVSAYYSHLRTHTLDGWPELSVQRDVIGETDAHAGMMLTTAFLERDDFYTGAVGPLHAIRHWNFDDSRFQTIRMEDMVVSPGDYLGPALWAHFPESRLPESQDHDFEAVAGRPHGQVDDASHYRSGQAEQWRTSLPAPLIKYVRAHYSLILGRYYRDALND